jgi:phage-related baseplate assembly protein
VTTTLSLTDLITTESRDEILESLVNLLAARQLPVTAWQPGNVFRTKAEIDAELLALAGRYVQLIAAGGYPSTAGGDWLTFLGEDFYDEPRKKASRARHRVTVTDKGSVGPRDFAVGDFIALGPGRLRFNLVVGGTVPLNGSNATFEVEAEAEGPAYNVPVGTIADFAIDQPGFSITNPDLGDGTASSLLTLGADVESDPDYAARLPLKWDAQGRAGNVEAWLFHALDADDQIRKALVLEHTPNNGDVTVYLAGSTGPVPSLVLANATTFLSNNARGLGTNMFVHNSSSLFVPVVGSVEVEASKRAAAEAAIAKAIAEYQALLKFGKKVVRAKVFDAIVSPAGVSNLNLLQPAVDVTPALGQVPVFVTSLSFVEV